MPTGSPRGGVDATDSSAASGALLSVAGVDVRLGGRAILQQVTFQVRPGEFTGLIGANGAGKTTLLRVILGVQQPTAGRVDIARGEPSTPVGLVPADPDPGRGGWPSRASQRMVGYVPQKVLLDRDLPLRARDVVGLGLDGSRPGTGWPSRRKRALVAQMLAAVDATRLADARVGELSGGEQQRVLIAHALISRPRLLLLDEPLANLDLRSGQEVVDLLAHIARAQRIAVLLSAHEMNPLLPVMDRVVYLADGRAASGPVDEVITTEVLSRLYGHHVDVLHVHGRILVVAGRGNTDHADSHGSAAGPSDPGGDHPTVVVGTVR